MTRLDRYIISHILGLTAIVALALLAIHSFVAFVSQIDEIGQGAFGYRELGANPAGLKGAQHCRAEVFLRQHGWVAMDPADVLKVMRQETPDWIKDTRHAVAAPVVRGLFGGWEGNWVGWNTGHDITLPGQRGKATLPFLMYPQGEDAAGRYDELAPDDFRYAMNAKEA